jgi:hypothetical protein
LSSNGKRAFDQVPKREAKAGFVDYPDNQKTPLAPLAFKGGCPEV